VAKRWESVILFSQKSAPNGGRGAPDAAHIVRKSKNIAIAKIYLTVNTPRPVLMRIMTALVVVFTHLTGVTSYEREVCSRYTSALCSPNMLSTRTALVRRGFITKDTSVCGLICAAIDTPTRLQIKENSGHYNGPRNLQRLSVLAIKPN